MPTQRDLLGYVVVESADRLVIRVPIISYFAVLGLYLLGLVAHGIAIAVGFLDLPTLWIMQPMMAAGFLFFTLLLCRGWTLDRKADSVRYFPWYLCKLSEIRGIRIVERRAGKYGHARVWTVELELKDGSQVRFAGFHYAQLGRDEARAMAAAISDWLRVSVTEVPLQESVPSI